MSGWRWFPALAVAALLATGCNRPGDDGRPDMEMDADGGTATGTQNADYMDAATGTTGAGAEVHPTSPDGREHPDTAHEAGSAGGQPQTPGH